MAFAGGTPELRPEGYAELTGDIFMECSGGAAYHVGTAIPTTNVVVYMSPGVSITSRVLGPGLSGAGTYLSDVLLLIDEPGSGVRTGATGPYGPNAPQSLCTTAQQLSSGCPAKADLDDSGAYEVAVVPGTRHPAPNVFQGEIGDYGPNSVAFYNVPILPPAQQGVMRVFRITNIRVPVPGGYLPNQLQAFISTNPNTVLPISSAEVLIGVVGPAMLANVNASPAGSGNPFPACVAQTAPTLAAQVTFSEGFATSFKTRVVAGGSTGANTKWAAEAQNIVSPSNQNIPGGLYGGFAQNNESGFILPALNFTDSSSNITYTAGLADFGTRLKAVFSNIPAGVTLYVSTTSTGTVAVPGGTAFASYAVLVAASQGNEANGDGSNFAPLTSTVPGSDGLYAYPLAADNSGVTAAVWEVVNSNPAGLDSLIFSVYIAYDSTLSTATPTNVALSFAPEPGGGSFSAANSTLGLTSPLPRFAVLNSFGGPFATITYCELSAGTSPVPLTYALGGAAVSQTRTINLSPSTLPVTVTPAVTTPTGGNWLSASLSGSTLTITANGTGLTPSATAYTGTVTLSAAGNNSVAIPVNLTVTSQPVLTINKSHSGNFAQGQMGATYSITAGNNSPVSSTNGAVTVQEQVPGGLSLVQMAGTGWDCSALPNCTRSDALAPGGQYPTITATVNVAGNASTPQVNAANVSGGGSAPASASDSTTVVPSSGWSIGLSHSGYFTEGENNAQYVVTVNNVSAIASNGTVTVTETVPTGLSLLSMNGSNWDCSSLPQCKRSDSLPAGQSYSNITVTVYVGTSVPLYVTNQVSISGGAFQKASAGDVTMIDTPALQYLISTYAGGFAPPTAVAGVSYPLLFVNSVTTDQFGNTYLSSSLGCVFRLDAAGMLMRVAGTCNPGFSGDGGLAVDAELNDPMGLAVDLAGTLYIADTYNSRIRQVTPSGIITTVAGTGKRGYSGDDIPATSAELNLPEGVAVDSLDNLYIADSGNYRIREVSNGMIVTVAGTGTVGSSGDGAAAANAQLNYPSAVAVDWAGDFYIADTFNNRVRKVAAGVITTVAGTGTAGLSGDGGAAVSAQLNSPGGIATDNAGDLYVADTSNERIRKVAANGIITTVAGAGIAGASLFSPGGVACDFSNNLYIADTSNGYVRVVNSSGTIATVAGNGVYPEGGDGGLATLASLIWNWGLALDGFYNLYIAGDGSRTVRTVAPSGILTTVGSVGPGTNQVSLAADSAGNIYFTGDAHVGKMAHDGSVTNIAGTGSAGYSGDNGLAVNAQLSSYIAGIALDAAGDVYISDVYNFRVRKISPEGTITTIAGTGTQGFWGDGGPGTSAQLTWPSGLAVDSLGNLYIVDQYRIRKLAVDGAISTVAGTGVGSNTGDGGPATAAAVMPYGSLAVDSAGNLYFGTLGSTIRKVSRGGIITTIAGIGAAGRMGDGGPATMAELIPPASLAVDPNGNVYVSEQYENAVRVLVPTWPVLTLTSTHTGNFALGQQSAQYEITVTAGPGTYQTSGAVTVTEALPPGLSLVSMSGENWNCPASTCSRSDALPAGTSYSPIYVTVNVSPTAPPQVINQVSVAGGGGFGASAEDPTFIGPSAPVLEISETVPGLFVQGESNATYIVNVGNQFAAPPTNGPVIVTPSVPNGLTIQSMTGTGWSCSNGSCTRSDSLAGGAQYPPIVVTASVSGTALSQVTASATASGGGSIGAGVQATNFNLVLTVCDVAGVPTPSAIDVQRMVNEALGIAPAVNDVNRDGIVNVAGVQKVLIAALGGVCPY
jgi:uncharacterized repeat protein (TIGR01451 family)